MTWACFAKFQIWWGMSLVTRESWLLRYMSLWKIFVGLLWMDFGWKYVVECWWFWYGSVSEMGFLAEGEVSLGKNRRQRWEKFINHRTIFFVFFFVWVVVCFERKGMVVVVVVLFWTIGVSDGSEGFSHQFLRGYFWYLTHELKPVTLFIYIYIFSF